MVLTKAQFLGCITKSIESFEQHMLEKDPSTVLLILAAKTSKLEAKASKSQRLALNQYTVTPSIAETDKTLSVDLPELKFAEDKRKKEKKSKSIIDECVPCWDRIKTVSELKISPSFNDVAIKNLTRQLNLKNILGLIADTGENRELDNICQYFDALKFQCIPDIQRLIALLSLVLRQLTELITADISALLGNLLIALYRPFLANLSHNLDEFTSLVLDPIECVKTSLFYQFNKVDFAVQTKRAKELKNNLYSNANNITNELRNRPSNTFNEGEMLLMDAITLAENWVRDKQRSVYQMMAEVFGKDDDTLIRLHAALRIGFILQILKVLERFLDKHFDFCQKDENREKALEKIIKEYVNELNTDQVNKIELVKKDGKFFIDSPYKTKTSNQVQTPEMAQNTSLPTLSGLSDITESFTLRELSCLQKINSSKIEQVKDWISKIENQEG